MLASSGSNQFGASLGAMAFPVIGPVGVVAIRQYITALVLVPTVRPKLRGLTRKQWLPILGLVCVYSVMNLSLYLAIDRIGLALAVTLEFLGPLAVAIGESRRPLDFLSAFVVAIGVLVLVNPGPSSDLIGIGLALIAAVAWGCYIFLNRAVGRSLPGLQGTATASIFTALLWLPIGLVWFWYHPPTPTALLLAAGCGVLSSVVPYVADLLALRRVPARIFGTFTSINPVWAALAGWLVLGQALNWHEVIGIALIVAGNTIVSLQKSH
ncbi:EamA family transporter [Corynebacterium sp. S7]